MGCILDLYMPYVSCGISSNKCEHEMLCLFLIFDKESFVLTAFISESLITISGTSTTTINFTLVFDNHPYL